MPRDNPDDEFLDYPPLDWSRYDRFIDWSRMYGTAPPDEPEPEPEEAPMPNCNMCYAAPTEDLAVNLMENGHYACQSCEQQYYLRCARCDDRWLSGDMMRVPGERGAQMHVCPECWRRYYTTCESCHGRVLQTNTRRLANGSLVCTACIESLVTCRDCGEQVLPIQSRSIPDPDFEYDEDSWEEPENYTYCTDCLVQNYLRCGMCSRMRPRAEVVRTQAMPDGRMVSMCLPCRELRVECRRCGCYYAGARCPCQRSQLLAYNYRPESPTFFHTEREAEQTRHRHKRLYLGWELEVELMNYRGDLSDLLDELRADWLYFKRDGSLSGHGDGGFEIVSQPMTPAWIKEHREEITTRLARLSALGCRSYDTSTCGLHVHMSKGAFTPYEFYKFSKLIYENRDFSLTIAQRSGDRVERYASFNKEDPRRMVRKARRMRDNCGTDRYVAVNVENENTIELRMFKGTLNARSFFKALEFSVAARQFAREESAGRMAPEHFYRWLDKNKASYPNLHGFVRERVGFDDDSVQEVLPVRPRRAEQVA